MEFDIWGILQAYQNRANFQALTIWLLFAGLGGLLSAGLGLLCGRSPWRWFLLSFVGGTLGGYLGHGFSAAEWGGFLGAFAGLVIATLWAMDIRRQKC